MQSVHDDRGHCYRPRSLSGSAAAVLCGTRLRRLLVVLWSYLLSNSMCSLSISGAKGHTASNATGSLRSQAYHLTQILRAQATRSHALSLGRAVHRAQKPDTPLESLTESCTAEFVARVEANTGLSGFSPSPRFPKNCGVPGSPGHKKIHAERSSSGYPSHRRTRAVREKPHRTGWYLRLLMHLLNPPSAGLYQKTSPQVAGWAPLSDCGSAGHRHRAMAGRPG